MDTHVSYIPNHELRLERIPGPGAGWMEIARFALTFNGFTYCGSDERYAEITGRRAQSTLSELRTLLFHEERSARHGGFDPSPSEMKYIEGLMEQIRNRVRLANELLR